MPDIEIIECRDDQEAAAWADEIRDHRRTVLLHIARTPRLGDGWRAYRRGELVAGGLTREWSEAAAQGRLQAYLREQVG